MVSGMLASEEAL